MAHGLSNDRKARLAALIAQGSSSTAAPPTPSNSQTGYSPSVQTSSSVQSRSRQDAVDRMVQSLPRIVMLRKRLEEVKVMHTKHHMGAFNVARREYLCAELMETEKIDGRIALEKARSICSSTVSNGAHDMWTYPTMRPVMKLAFPEENWTVIAMMCWTFDPQFEGRGFMTGRLINTLKVWSGDKSPKDIPSSLPPELLFSLYPIHSLLFNDPNAEYLLPRRSPIGRCSELPIEASESQSKTTSTTSRSTGVCIVDKIDEKSRNEPGYLIDLSRQKGISRLLGIEGNRDVPIPIVGDLEIKVDVTDNEAAGIDAMSIISENADCHVSRTVGGRFCMSCSIDGLTTTTVGGYELFVDGVLAMTKDGALKLTTFSNSWIDPRGIWDAARVSGRLYRQQRPRFAKSGPYVELFLVNKEGKRCPVKVLNLGGSWQSSQYRIDCSFWNVRESGVNLFATADHPERTKTLDAIDRIPNFDPLYQAQQTALNPRKLLKSLADVQTEQEIAYALARLARRDLERVKGTFNERQLLLSDDDDDDNEDSDDGAPDEDQNVNAHETYEEETIKSNSKPLSYEQVSWLYSLWVWKYGREKVLSQYARFGLTRAKLDAMLAATGLDSETQPTLPKLVLYLYKLESSSSPSTADVSSSSSSTSAPVASTSTAPASTTEESSTSSSSIKIEDTFEPTVSFSTSSSTPLPTNTSTSETTPSVKTLTATGSGKGKEKEVEEEEIDELEEDRSVGTVTLDDGEYLGQKVTAIERVGSSMSKKRGATAGECEGGVEVKKVKQTPRDSGIGLDCEEPPTRVAIPVSPVTALFSDTFITEAIRRMLKQRPELDEVDVVSFVTDPAVQSSVDDCSKGSVERAYFELIERI